MLIIHKYLLNALYEECETFTPSSSNLGVGLKASSFEETDVKLSKCYYLI